MRARLVAVGLAAALLAGCSATGDRSSEARAVTLEADAGPPADSTATTAPTATTATTAPTTSMPATTVPTGRPIGDIAPGDLPTAVAAALDQFWAETLAATVGLAYTPLAGGLRPYRPSVDAPPTCGANTVSAALAQGNAFYCGVDDAVTWDDEGLMAEMLALSGPVGVALVLAHEWGHAVQHRIGGPPRGAVRELQADCYAGAFTAWTVGGRSPDLYVTGAQVDGAVAGYLTVRDAGAADGEADGSHGTAFDRVAAFGNGYVRGPKSCLDYRDHPPQLVGPGTVAEAGALQMSTGQTVDLVTADLEAYWSRIVANDTGRDVPVAASQVALQPGQPPPPCPGPPSSAPSSWSSAGPAASTFAHDPSTGGVVGVVACPATATVSWDLDGFLTPLGAQVGDFGVALALATGWSELVVARRSPFARSPRDMADCLSGSWTADASHQLTPTFLQLQPGDLDEALAGMLALRQDGRRDGEVTAFRRANAFQRGFEGGREACVAFG